MTTELLEKTNNQSEINSILSDEVTQALNLRPEMVESIKATANQRAEELAMQGKSEDPIISTVGAYKWWVINNGVKAGGNSITDTRNHSNHFVYDSREVKPDEIFGAYGTSGSLKSAESSQEVRQYTLRHNNEHVSFYVDQSTHKRVEVAPDQIFQPHEDSSDIGHAAATSHEVRGAEAIQMYPQSVAVEHRPFYNAKVSTALAAYHAAVEAYNAGDPDVNLNRPLLSILSDNALLDAIEVRQPGFKDIVRDFYDMLRAQRPEQTDALTQGLSERKYRKNIAYKLGEFASGRSPYAVYNAGYETDSTKNKTEVAPPIGRTALSHS